MDCCCELIISTRFLEGVMKQELYYATGNAGKFTEVAKYIQLHAPHIELKQFAVDLPEVQTTDQLAIAVAKAQQAFKMIQKPLLIDDSAIYFNKFNKFPGTLSKFVYSGLEFEGVKRLFDVGDPAHFLLYILYVDARGQEHVFEGRCDGHLIKPLVFDADPSLPYDSFFVPDGASISYAKMRHEFTLYAHYFYRIRGLEQFLSWYLKQ